MLTIQYLEYSPELADLDPNEVTTRLRSAAQNLPFTHLLVGWSLPPPILDAIRREAERLGLRLLRWQPLLTPDRSFTIDPSWHTQNLIGGKVGGYRNLPEFTFLCPNHPDVLEALQDHLHDLDEQGSYQGFFLDRVRYPSPSTDPGSDLACFCEHCVLKAADMGLDLAEIRQAILQHTQTESGRITLVKALLSRSPEPGQTDQDLAISQLITFRQRCIGNFLEQVTQPLRLSRLEIGLDGFSPCLAPMVGQDIQHLSALVEWVKLMTYAHSLAPAGLPYELCGILDYLTSTTSLSDAAAMRLISQWTGLLLPPSRQLLRQDGISSTALAQEVYSGMAMSTAPVLAGIELVDLQGVTRLTSSQIQADMATIKRLQPAGLAISWDLLHIPLERLELVRTAYLVNE